MNSVGNARSPLRGRQPGLLLFFLGILAALVLMAAQFTSHFELISPSDGSKGVHPGRDMKIRITEAAFSNRAYSISLQSQDRSEVPVSVSFDARDKVITIRPKAPLELSTRYALCVSHSDASSRFVGYLDERLGNRSCSTFETIVAEPTGTTNNGAPILIVTGRDNPYGVFYEEILKAEGLNLFSSVSAGRFDPEKLAAYSVVLLATSSLPPAAIAALESWVREGGSLIAMRPEGEVKALMCVSRAGAALRSAYLLPNPELESVRALATRPLQIHGGVEIYEEAPSCRSVRTVSSKPAMDEGAIAVARLLETRTGALPYAAVSMRRPAVSMRRLGRGHTITFAYDLARSVAYTRQGNPAWAGQERDGSSPRRPNDLFYPDHLDRDLIGVPQADEHQRLLANLILSTARMPLPRLWYLPDSRRAALIMVGDDHATEDGSAKLLAKLSALSRPDCQVERWECLRATALLSPHASFPADLAYTYRKQGFEIGVHVDTGCRNQDAPTLEKTIAAQTDEFRKRYPSLPSQTSQRLHCIVWNGWTESAEIESRNGIRFDMNYYNWPPAWLTGRSGFMTGSAMPMPFVSEDGKVLDVYQAATQLVNEDGVPHRQGAVTMLQKALGPDEFYGAPVTHYDFSDDYADVLIKAAQEHEIALISAEQMLSWVEGRNNSYFADVGWENGILSFTPYIADGAEYADIMLPLVSDAGRLDEVRCGNDTVPLTVQAVKGLSFASFAARAGTCRATYRGPVG